MLFRRVPLPEPPGDLARGRSRSWSDPGYPEQADGSRFRYFRVDPDYLQHTLHEERRGAAGKPGDLRRAPYFFYRQSPRPLAPPVSSIRPARRRPSHAGQPASRVARYGRGSARPDGRLLRLYAIPPTPDRLRPPAPTRTGSALFRGAELGFALTGFTRPTGMVPPSACDHQAAWTGELPDRPAPRFGSRRRPTGATRSILGSCPRGGRPSGRPATRAC